VQRLIDQELGTGVRRRGEGCVVVTSEERHRREHLVEHENAGLQSVVEIGGEVSDLIGEVDELGFERRPQGKKILCEIGVVGSRIVAGVLDDAFAKGEGEVEPAVGCIALLEPGDDAQGVQIVIEGEAVRSQNTIEGFFSRVTERRMTDIVGQRESLGEISIEAESVCKGAGNLRYLEGVREPAAKVVSRGIIGEPGEHLSFSCQAAEGPCVQNARGIAGKRGAVRVGRLRMCAGSHESVFGDSNGNGKWADDRRVDLHSAPSGINKHISRSRTIRGPKGAIVSKITNHRGPKCYKALRVQILDNPVGWGVPSCRFFEGYSHGPFPRRANLSRLDQEATMKTMRPIALAVLALGVAWITGCDRHSDKEVFYLVSANSALPYWQTAAAGFNRAAAQFKVTAKVVGPDNYDPQAELAALQKAVAAKPSGILISVSDVSVLQPEIDAAIQAGVPVITVDSDAAGSHRLYFIGTNNLEAGRMGGHRLIEKLGGKGNVVFFTLAGQPNIEERLKGFKDVLAARPEIKIVDVIDIKSDASLAYDKAQELLALSGPKKIDGFVCLESAAGKPVSDAIKRANATDRVLIAWDANQETLNSIKEGTIDSTVAQKPFTMGYYGLKALDEIFHAPPPQLGKDFASDPFSPYPVFVDTGTSLVDKNNVDLYLAGQAK
jgi:ribose transport system substrate-binding protein